jgi:hypothetical protein
MRLLCRAGAIVLFFSGCGAVQDGPTPVPPVRTPVKLEIHRDDAFATFYGDSFPLAPVTLDAHGDTVPPESPIQFLSRNPEIVSVSGTGQFTARGLGQTWIVGWTYASTRQLLDSVQVSVRCTTEGANVVVAPPSLLLSVGESITPVIVGATYCMGRIPFTAEYRWRSADTAVAVVDSLTGLTTGRAPGITVLVLHSTQRAFLRDLLVTVTDSTR